MHRAACRPELCCLANLQIAAYCKRVTRQVRCSPASLCKYKLWTQIAAALCMAPPHTAGSSRVEKSQVP